MKTIRKIIDISGKQWKINVFDTHLYLRLLELGSVVSEEWGEAINYQEEF